MPESCTCIYPLLLVDSNLALSGLTLPVVGFDLALAGLVLPAAGVALRLVGFALAAVSLAHRVVLTDLNCLHLHRIAQGRSKRANLLKILHSARGSTAFQCAYAY